jgi:Pyridoxamine 5'-phosphate oxidase
MVRSRRSGQNARRPAGRRGVLVVDGASGWAPPRHPLLGVWLDGALYFCTGPAERKAKNLAQNPNCVLTTGCNGLDDGLDLVVEGAATKVSQGAELRSVADTFESKYGRRFTAPDGTWFGLGEAIRGGDAPVYGSLPRRPSGSARAGSSARLGGASS